MVVGGIVVPDNIKDAIMDMIANTTDFLSHEEKQQALLDDAVVIYHEVRPEEDTPEKAYERAMKGI